MVAVTKTVSASLVREAYECGLRHFGENRVQEAVAKEKSLDDLRGVTWHLLGHLQTNKAKKALGLFDCVQSLDSLRLARVLNGEAERCGNRLPCLVEIKVSEEPEKQGLPPESLDEFLARADEWPFLSLEGLMIVAPYFDDPRRARPYFRRARDLFDRNRGRFRGERPLLSMGMSQDFEPAVEEGANMIRIGTALFGERV